MQIPQGSWRNGTMVKPRSLQPAEPEASEFAVNPNSSSVEVIAALPAYNEARFIGSVVIDALQYVDLVIVVYDGSSDNTAYIAETAGARVVRHGKNRGYGAAISTA